MIQLPPGLELDQLIAKKVLGWWHDPPEIGGPRAWWYSPKNPEKPRALPNFSTDIRAAWLFAEKFRFYISPVENEQWVAFSPGKLKRKNISLSAPHAICLAALAEVEDDD